MAEHSICQPGKPLPHGLSHSIWRCWSVGLNFHRAKSVGLRFSPISMRAPACRPSISRRRQGAVIGQFGGVEIDAVGGAVGKALLFDAADELDLLGDVVGGPAPDVRLEDIQRAADRAVKACGVELGDLPGGLAGAARAFFHFVFAGIGIRDQVADIGDVHHMFDLVTVEFQHPAQQIFEDIGAQVADMGVVVDGRAAGIQANFRGIERRELADSTGEGIKQRKVHFALFSSRSGFRVFRSISFA